MSWEGHLGGFITGLLFAVIFRKAIAKPERYVWQEPQYNEDDDPFLRHFDENGNFIENLEPEISDENTSLANGQQDGHAMGNEDHLLSDKKEQTRSPRFNYIYKERPEKE